MAEELDPENDRKRKIDYTASEFLGAGQPFGVDLSSGEPIELSLLGLDDIRHEIDAEGLAKDSKDIEWQTFLADSYRRRQQLRLDGRIK